MKRVFWLMVGLLALGLAIVGVVLPLLPTVPFLLVAAYAFARSSERLHNWLVTHPKLGPPIKDWQREGAIHRSSKIAAVATMILVFVLSLIMGVGTRVLIIQAVVLSAAMLFILTRPTPSSEEE